MATDALYSVNELVGNGSQRSYEFSFVGGYISRAHVFAALVLADGSYQPIAFSFTNDNTLLLASAVPAGQKFRIYRQTPADAPLANFTDGAIVTERNLDDNASQAVFLAQESLDNGSSRLDSLESGAIKSPAGGVVSSGFVVIGSDGKATGQDFLNVIKTATPVYDDGAWGGVTSDDGAWG